MKNLQKSFINVILIIILILLAGAGVYFYTRQVMLPTSVTVPSPTSSSTITNSKSIPTKTGTSCGNVNGVPFPCAPEDIILKANALIISRVGQNVFKEYIKYHPLGSGCYGGTCDLSYDFVVPGEDVNIPIGVSVNQKTNQMVLDLLQGVPNCVASPDKCNIQINKTQALQIAQKNLPVENSSWYENFSYDPQSDSFMWVVDEQLGTGCYTNWEAQIDATNGTVKATSSSKGCTN